MTGEELNRLFNLSKSVDRETAFLQTATCARIISLLEEVPGMILGDDVGMGKTYVAFGAAVYFLSRYPRKKVLIITPGWQLNEKWFRDIRNFIAQNLNAKQVRLEEKDIYLIHPRGYGNYADQLKNASQKGKVILVPINVFSSLTKEFSDEEMNGLFPKASLLILDEAHKMKNEKTVKRKALTAGISRRFGKGIFLTATPFQLGEGELKSVLAIFGHSTCPKKEKENFQNLLDDLFEKIASYENSMSMFEEYVHNLLPDEEVMLEKVIQNHEEKGFSGDVRETYCLYEKLLQQKNELESVMRKVIVRNVKKKDIYRKEIAGAMEEGEQGGLALSREAYLPYGMMEKAIYQILEQGDRTFIANVKQSFTSSFEAVMSSAVMNREVEAVRMLSQLKPEEITHPKVEQVCQKAVELLKSGRKSLIFCDRNETMEKLKKELLKVLNGSRDMDISRLFPENREKGFDNYCRRFYSVQDISWFLLQESYIHSVLRPLLCRLGIDTAVIPKAKEIKEEVNVLYRKFNTSRKTNYRYVKRIVEYLVFRHVLSGIRGWRKALRNDRSLRNTLDAIMDEKYIRRGLSDEESFWDEEEEDSGNGHIIRRVSNEVIQRVLSYPGIWAAYEKYLNRIEPSRREWLVDEMIRFLRRDRRFFIQLREMQNRYAGKKKDYSFLIEKTFRTGGVPDWKSAYERFLENYCREEDANAVGSRDELCLGLKSRDMVDIINAHTKNDKRRVIRAGFNTPFNPQILIVSRIMEEGIDLQRECKEIIHYDMEWNPASLEQRVGRVDRIGSLVARMRSEGREDTLDIYYPYIRHTIDESIYRTVKDREKWFNLLLGGTPQWDTFEADPEVTAIKPWVFQRLQVNLGVEILS